MHAKILYLWSFDQGQIKIYIVAFAIDFDNYLVSCFFCVLDFIDFLYTCYFLSVKFCDDITHKHFGTGCW